MAARVHVIQSAASSPSAAPDFVGQHWIRVDTKQMWRAKGTTGVGDWVEETPDTDTGITQLTGDVTAGPGSGSQVATIANDAVTFAKMQNISTNKLLGRSTAGTGDTEQISIGTGLSLSAGTLTNTVTDTGITQLTGDATAGPGSGSQALTLATVNSNVGQFLNANVTVNAKGLVTAAINGANIYAYTYLGGL